MAKNIKLSATRINSFLDCKQKYFFNYNLKLPQVSNPAFKLGLAVHESLELAGKIWKESVQPAAKREFSKTETATILEKYNEVSIREGITDYEIHEEGMELVKRRLNNFCPGEKILDLEIKFGFWNEGKNIVSKYGVPLIGAIDVVCQYDEDTLLIIDYKTSKTAPTASQMSTDIQLSLYDIVARQLYPQYKRVILSLDLLKSDMLYTYRTEDQRERFQLYLKEIYRQMLDLKEEEVKASLNQFCPWCSYRDYCSTYKRACEKSNYEFLPVMQYDDAKLIEEWNSVKSIKKILENRERELGMVMMEKIKMNGMNLKGEAQEIYIRQNSSNSYDLNTVHKVVPQEDFPGLVNLNKKAVESYMNINPAVKSDIVKSATTNFTSPFLAARKIRKSKNN